MITVSAHGQFDIQGHRGCRGLMPENTIPAFIRAVQLGVTTLELDVVISADNRVVVSHDPFMSHEICLKPDGQPIKASDEQKHLIFQMSLAQVQSYDCGSLPQKRFPGRAEMKVYKPTLGEVIDTVERYIAANHLPAVWYNIETKCSPEGDHRFHPPPEVFAERVLDEIYAGKVQSKCMIQSFDVRTLQYLEKRHTGMPLVLLVANMRGIGYNLDRLGFVPDVYSPHYKRLTPASIGRLHAKGMRVIPWTVNEPRDMSRLIRQGVDGLITDYPDRLINVLREKNP